MTFQPQDDFVKKEGYYTKYHITAADTTGKYEESNPGDPYNREMKWIWSKYHLTASKPIYKFLYYDEKTDEDVKQFWNDVKRNT